MYFYYLYYLYYFCWYLHNFDYLLYVYYLLCLLNQTQTEKKYLGGRNITKTFILLPRKLWDYLTETKTGKYVFCGTTSHWCIDLETIDLWIKKKVHVRTGDYWSCSYSYSFVLVAFLLFVLFLPFVLFLVFAQFLKLVVCLLPVMFD